MERVHDRRHAAGFTLIETLITLAITAVLSSLAYPSFEGQVLRARRSDGLVAIMRTQLAEEHWRANAAAYGSLAEIGVESTSSGGHYRIELAPRANGYRITATAVGTQARDSACRVLQVSMAGGDLAFASGSSASAANDAGPNRSCWNR